jgi:hypothetical protein
VLKEADEMIAIILSIAGWSAIAALVVPGWAHTALLVSAGLMSLALLRAWVLNGYPENEKR